MIKRLSNELQETSRHIESAILRKVAEIGNTTIGERVGHDKSWVSKKTAPDALQSITTFIAALDLQLVDVSATGGVITITTEEHEALKTLARKAL
ncbi:MAG: hypothetical protein Q9M19_01290 [Mariprofundaceae bacterium]|nr:hypothetical protein [Mariprofundaceae bacterium]